MTVNNEKDALKQLRQQRKASIDRARQGIKEQNRRLAAIRTHLGEEAATVPEIAAATGIPSAEVLMVLSAMRKYGEVAEADKVGSYFKYQLTKTQGDTA